MGLPNMTGWSKRSQERAFKELEERDALLKDIKLGVVGVDGYDEEDLSRDSQNITIIEED